MSFEKEGLLAAGAEQPTPHSHYKPRPPDDTLTLSSSALLASPQPTPALHRSHSGMGTPMGAGVVLKSTMRSVEELDDAAQAWSGSGFMRELRALEVLYVFHLTSLGVYGVPHSVGREGVGVVGRFVHGVSTGLGHFRLLLWRCCLNYVRNPGNAMARLFITTLTALVHGLAFFNLGQEGDAQNRLGSLYFGCTSLALMPYASMSLFVYDRQFYAKDSAAGLYGVLPYFLSSVLLEALLLSLSGLIYATITYALVGQVLSDGSGSFVALAGTYVLHSLVSAQFVQLMAILAPNQVHKHRPFLAELHRLQSQTRDPSFACTACIRGATLYMHDLDTASTSPHPPPPPLTLYPPLLSPPTQDVGFVAGAGYTSASMLVCGFLVTYPKLGAGLKWMQWLTFFKFTFAALAANEFQGTPLQSSLIEGALDLKHPNGVGVNLLCLAGFGVAFSLMSMVGLKFLHRERR